MQQTTLGHNRTGSARTPLALEAMNDAAEALTPYPEADTSQLSAYKAEFVNESDAVGSVPLPASAKGYIKTGVEKLKGGQPTVLIDKMGERLAFERTGTRLYDALIAKYQALLESSDGVDPLPAVLVKPPLETLLQIRGEELAHFQLLTQAVLDLGGDPTSQTPCADVTAVASMGIMQVVNDPRTTLAQCLNAMLTAELTDTAGWELLISLADAAGESTLSERFTLALAQEEKHVSMIKTWLKELLASPAKVPEAV